MKAAKVILLCRHQGARAQEIAQQYAIPLVDASGQGLSKPRTIEGFIRAQTTADSKGHRFVFLLGSEGLSLAQLSATGLLSIRADFHSPQANYRRHKGGGKGEMIAKAVGVRSGELPRILDATAGLGGDAFVLASLGCQVTMTERVPEVRTLLADGLRAAKEWGRAQDASLVETLEHLSLVAADATDYMRELGATQQPDVVYLDPMFPAGNKRAQVKKEMQVFHHLVGADADAHMLWQLAQNCAKKRVVVKRPRTAPALAAAPPSYALTGKRNRYDIYLV